MRDPRYDEVDLPVAIACVTLSGVTLGIVLAAGNLLGVVVLIALHAMAWGWCHAAMREKYQRRNPWRRHP